MKNSVIVLCLLGTLAFSPVKVKSSRDSHYSDFDEEDDSRIHPDLPVENPFNNKAILPEELETEFWMRNARETVAEKVETYSKPNTNVAKNIIFFIGDGMSFQTVAATRMHSGNENNKLSFEKFPYFGMAKTYCVNRQVSDSACTATAYLSGVKANYGTIGLDAGISRYDCEGQANEAHQTTGIGQWSLDSCKGVGLVTTTRITHATPAGLFAHIADRYWENDVEVEDDNCDPETTDDIAEQLIRSKVGSKLKVILGGGRSEFLDKSVTDEEQNPGLRGDGQNLIEEWKTERSKDGNAEYIWRKSELLGLDVNSTDYLLGLFEGDHMKFHLDAVADPEEPTLSELVATAIKMLQKEEKGYFLFVEGGKIDVAHHESWTRRALDETLEFSNAVQLAREMTSEEDTLIVVSADHGHTMTFAGYPSRGADVLGIAQNSNIDRMPFSVLSYANGAGYKNTYNELGDQRLDITGFDSSDPEFQYFATVPLNVESHGGDDVGVYASGPWAHLFVGQYEQNILPYAMAYAAQIGAYGDDIQCSSASTLAGSIFLLLFIHLLRQINIL
ncbi:membrane-bound alkaline phosphatase-like [Lutzomyia longipalpis]|uniref:membrane-bound alkaline phosphatase-like n=1 Tax=Lutzomyia longipalpis TaxID=7200 RepID=UPI002483ED14|nr:membrane-bound alkaline phosphatase-like [Lutzomyia longipalpis]